MKKLISLCLIILSTQFLIGCTYEENQMAGVGLGAVAGGAIGSAVSNGNPAATIGGAAIGGVVGYQATR